MGAAFLGDLPANFLEMIGLEKARAGRTLGINLPFKIGGIRLAKRSGLGVRSPPGSTTNEQCNIRQITLPP